MSKDVDETMELGTRLVSTFRKIVKTSSKNSEFTDVLYGQVISVSPLAVKIDEKNVIEANMLEVGALCKQTIIEIPFPEKGEVKHKHQAIHNGRHDTTMELPKIQLWRGLNVGDWVLLLRYAQGQKFYIMQRKEGIP